MGNGKETYRAEIATDGSGDWCITLPVGCDEADFGALSSVVDGIHSFLAPTLSETRYALADRDDGLRPAEGA